jgi:hypothetical protein
MSAPDKIASQPSLHATKMAAWLAFLFFLLGVPFTPGYGSSLGMPWPLFFCTYGAMAVSGCISFVGYFSCKARGERLSTFYLICPLLLFAVLLFLFNRYDIVRAILRFEGKA